jgi:hypothetical protein
VSPEQIVAIGRLGAGTAWVGFVHERSGFQLVFGEPDGRIRSTQADGPRSRLDLLLVAQAYFAESAADPPPDLEATHADLADLLRWLMDTEPAQRVRTVLREAVDAVDDGLAGEAVVGALAHAAKEMSGDQVEREDPLDLLMYRYRALRG